MKLNKTSQLILAATVCLAAATLVTACATLTVDFVFVTSAKAAGTNNYGNVNVFEVNSESGAMRQIPSSPFPSGGRNPVADAVSSDHNNLFVVNQDDNTIVQFVIGNDGKLYPFNTVNTPGIFPLAIAASTSNIFVIDTYQPLPTCSTATPCAGSIAVYPLVTGTNGAATSTNSCVASVCLGTPATNPAISQSYWPLAVPGKPTDIIVPTGITVLPSGSDVYISAYDSSVSPAVGYVFGFSVGSGGVLSAVSGSPFVAGVQPSGIASDPSNKYVYVTDYAKGDVLGFSVSSGALSPLSGSPYPAGNQPSAIVVDQAYSYVYVTNYLDSTVTAYSMSNGSLTRLGSYETGLQPVAVGIDPSKNHFLYTLNYLGNNVSGFELSNTAGTLVDSMNSPYVANPEPTSVAAIPHGGS